LTPPFLNQLLRNNLSTPEHFDTAITPGKAMRKFASAASATKQKYVHMEFRSHPAASA
jgi:hypothetical protein